MFLKLTPIFAPIRDPDPIRETTIIKSKRPHSVRGALSAHYYYVAVMSPV